MEHLSLETIARLVDDAPSTDEAAHLDSCAECRSELEGMIEDVHALSALPDMARTPDQWATLERRLLAEGIIRTQPNRFAMRSTRMMQIAAALTLFVGGSFAGRITAPDRPILATTPATPIENHVEPDAALAASPVGDNAPQSFDVAPAVQTVALAPSVPAGRARPEAMLASDYNLPIAGTVEEAAQILRVTEAQYLAALTRFAELSTNAEPGDLVARLAALQSIIMTTQAALGQMPGDPVINGYHLTALAQRDATLRQVAAASNERWY